MIASPRFSFPEEMLPDPADEGLVAPTVTSRSPAQQRAARLNGSKGRGPITDAGKRRSSMNAVKHGLLARHLCPSADFREEHLDYEQQLKGLLAEYQPVTQTEVNLVESLAADWVRMGRIGQAREVMSAPITRHQMPIHTAGDLDEAIRARRILKRLAQHLADGEPLNASKSRLKLAVKFVESSIASLEQLQRIYREAGSKENKAEFWEDNGEQIQKLRRIKPRDLGVFDDVRLTGILSGTVAIEPSHVDRWREVLSSAAEHANREAAFLRPKRDEHEQLCRHELDKKFMSDLTRNFMVTTYEARCRNEVERKIDLLFRLKREREDAER